MRNCTSAGIDLDLWTEPSGASRVDLDIFSHDDEWTEVHSVPLEYANPEKDEDHWFLPLVFASDDEEAVLGSTTAAHCTGGFAAHFALMFSVYDANGDLALCHTDGDDTTPFDNLGCHEGWE